ncbi:MAG: hypothetical protein HYR88_14935, partial [Verrucomicrobia bacterium]|nr:hypothetical protein [Verrucomicrobiota bacterium]
MKLRSWFAALLALGIPILGCAQVQVDIQLDQHRFLRDERLPVNVRVTNRSGRPLKIGQTPDWLSFSVETKEGKVVSAIRDIEAGGQFQLDPADSVSKAIDITEGFDLSQPGTYRVSAAAKFGEIEFVGMSASVLFEIVRGTQLWEEVCGAPETNGAPRWVRYSLLHANHTRPLQLYARIADEADAGWARVFSIGNTVSFATPEKIIDPVSRLHVLFQSSPRGFDYVRITPRGALEEKRVYEILGSSRPRLKMNEEGQVVVVGGVLLSPTNSARAAVSAPTTTNALA